MKRLIVLLIAVGLASLAFASGCTKDDSVSMTGPSVTTAPSSKTEEDATAASESEEAESIFMPLSLTSKGVVENSSGKWETDINISLEGQSEGVFTPKATYTLTSLSPSYYSGTYTLQGTQFTVDLGKNIASIVMDVKMSYKSCSSCTSTVQALEDISLDFELEREAEGLAIKKAKVSYSGPNISQQAPLSHLDFYPTLTYGQSSSGEKTLQVTSGIGTVLVDRTDEIEDGLVSKRSVELLSAYDYTLELERDAESGMIESGLMMLQAFPVPMSYTHSAKEISGKEVLEVVGGGSNTDGGNTAEIETNGLFGKSQSAAIVQERAVIMDAIILCVAQLAPLWTVLP